MNTNKTNSTKTKSQKQPAAGEAESTIKAGVQHNRISLLLLILVGRNSQRRHWRIWRSEAPAHIFFAEAKFELINAFPNFN